MKISTAILGVSILVLFSFKSVSQPIDTVKYLMVLNYLHSDSLIIQKMKNLYSRTKIVDKEARHVEFNINETVEFFYLSIFRDHDSLKSTELGIDQELIDNSKLYEKAFYFKPFESSFLKNISRATNARLFLTFSKPVGNYVIAELCSYKNPPRASRRFGIGMSILFVFNSSGFITRTSITSGVYN